MTTTAILHQDLVEKSKQGERLAQYQLYQQYAKAMFNICYRMMNSHEEAEDVLQESFTAAFRQLNSFRYESSFGSWIKRIVVNHCINALKKKRVELELQEDVEKYGLQEEQEELKDQQLDVKRVMEAMEQLPDGYRVVFSLYLLEGYDHGEIAEIMNISESTSKSQYMRAKSKIRTMLQAT